MEIADFLLARIAEDELVTSPFRNNAGAVKRWKADETGGKVRQIGPTEFGLPDVVSESDIHLTAEHIAAWDPARVLAECAAKRRIVEDGGGGSMLDVAGEVDAEHEWTMRCLALPYADHPDYREEWKP